MQWKEMLRLELESAYRTTEGLMDMTEGCDLEWKPSAANNWMTTGQLLLHLTNSCGAGMHGFATGDWGLPEGVDLANIPPEEMLPPAEKLPSIGSVKEAKAKLAEDKALAVRTLDGCSEEQLVNQIAPACWDELQYVLGHRFLQMVHHLNLHKAQLFYYLKLQGRPVNTMHLWG
ncbi:DinB family protein [bacterium]|nr:DinB family protein [bacterium]